ncbi:unnamed protein product [Cylindrotheca closterium]|uniref:Peptidase M6-like domain-containing protein n=1 Tax=Cylindrotheca closterium TaxID=2856 RepID=A0AAD2FJI9_9STRA|nr:unnamed protein product [Cylindrotheca closterium]
MNQITNLLLIFTLLCLPSLCQGQAETIKVLVVLTQWANHADRALIPKEDIESMWNGPRDPNTAPGEFIAQYIESNSYGKYTIEATVIDWYQLTVTEEEASNGALGNSVPGRPDIEDNLLPALEAAVAGGIDLTEYSRDGSRFIRGVVFMHSGYAGENGGTDCETGADYLNRIQSKSWGTDESIAGTNLFLSTMVTVSVYRGICDLQIQRIGVVIHEWMHAEFGLEDFYDTGGRYNGSRSATGGIGAFGIMSFAGGQGYDYALPGLMNPYCKMEIGALEPIEITVDGIYDARPSAIHPDVYIIREPYEEGEYLLIENRQPLLSDAKLWGPGGIVIYHVDENMEGYGNLVRGGPFVEGWPGNGDHYKVAVLQADSLYELEMAINLGHNDDFWKEGDVLGPGNGESVATDAGTYPNTDSYVDGNIRVTDLIIDLFTAQADGVWSFRVQGLQEAPSSAPSVAPSQDATLSSVPSQKPSTSLAPSLSLAPSFAIEPVNCFEGIDDDPTMFCNCASDCLDDNRDFKCDCVDAEQCCDEYETPPPTAAPQPTPPPTTPPPTAVGDTPPPTAPPTPPPTSPPTPPPTPPPTVLVTNRPTADRQGECLVTVFTNQCDTFMESKNTQDMQQDQCDCYNFCNGVELPCCPFGNDCSISCNGELVAGCQVPAPEPTPPPTPPPTRPINTCQLSINTQSCDTVSWTDMQPVQGCDCYNFCNGAYSSCCTAGQPCGMECGGSVVAGCEFMSQPNGTPTPVPVTPVPTTATPTADPGPSTFFFWPDGMMR